MVDAGETVMSISPAQPGRDPNAGVEGDSVEAEGNGEDDIGAGEAHKTEVTVGSEAATVRGEELLELKATLVEGEDATNAVVAGNATDEDWWAVDKDESYGGVVGEGVAAQVFEDIESMALGDVLEDHAQDWDTQTNGQVYHDSAAFLRKISASRHGRLECGSPQPWSRSPTERTQCGKGGG